MQFATFTSLALAGLVALAQASPMASGNVLGEALQSVSTTSSAPSATGNALENLFNKFDSSDESCGLVFSEFLRPIASDAKFPLPKVAP